jgi:hypothetical protein
MEAEDRALNISSPAWRDSIMATELSVNVLCQICATQWHPFLLGSAQLPAGSFPPVLLKAFEISGILWWARQGLNL